MSPRLGMLLLATIAGFMIAIAYYERQAEPVEPAPVVPRAAVTPDGEEIIAPEGFSQANWTVDPEQALEGSLTSEPDRKAQRKEPTWAGSEIIMPVK